VLLLAAWSGLAGGAAWAQDDVLQPVPAELLSGQTLSVLRSNFSISAPDPAWEWLQVNAPGVAEGSAFACRHTGTDARITVTVMELDTRGMNADTFAKGFVSGATKSLEAQGWSVSEAQVQPSAVPVPGSVRFSSTAQRADGTTAYMRGYVVKADRAYAIQEFTTEAAESKALQSVAASFRLIEKPPRYAPPSLGGLYVGLLVVVWGLGALVNRFAGRSVVNGALAAGVLILIAAIVLVARIAGDVDAEQLGFRVGEPFLPLLIAAWGARRYQKKKDEEELLAARARQRTTARRYEPRRPGASRGR